VHYSAKGQSQLAGVSFRCNANGTGCSSEISGNVEGSFSLAPGAGSCLISPALNVLRQYTVDSNGLVNEGMYDPDIGRWRAPKPIATEAKAHKASPIVADMVNGEIWLFWFDEQKRLQTSTSVWTSATWTQGKL